MTALRTRTAKVYLDFLTLATTARSSAAFPELDPLEEKILNTVAIANARDERLCVRDLMAFDALGAPATIHGRLKAMREKGWLQLGATEDSRRKQVELGKAGRKYVSRMSVLMQRVAQRAAL